MIECIFGWGKQHGTLRRTKHRGIRRVADNFLTQPYRLQSGPHSKTHPGLIPSLAGQCAMTHETEFQHRNTTLLTQQPTLAQKINNNSEAFSADCSHV
jgi:hypothetical protein